MAGGTCPNCGTAVLAGARFCNACGTPIPAGRTCANCGAVLSETAQFCGSCGAPAAWPLAETGQETMVSARPSAAPPLGRAAPPSRPLPHRAEKKRGGGHGSWLPVLLGAAGLVVVCVCAGALLLVLRSRDGGGGLSRLTPTVPATSTPANLARLTPLVSQKLAPSADPQTVGEEGRVRVTVPGGLLSEERTLTISSVEGYSEPRFPVTAQVTAIYDVSLGDLHQLDMPLLVELAYDPAKLRGSLPPEDALVAMYWDEALNDWSTLPFYVDTGRNTLVILTMHLSTFVGAEFVSDGHIANDHFSLRYDPADYKSRLDGGLVFGESLNPAHKDYLGVVWDSLNEARQSYVDADLRDTYTIKWQEKITSIGRGGIPTTRIQINYNVFLGGDDDASRNKLTGDISIPYKTTYAPSGVKLMTAHEVFHAVQARYYTMAGLDNLAFFLTTRRWWMESTAEYAAARIAWKAGLPGMGGTINPRYLEESLLSSDRDHAYNTAWFIEFLVKNKVPASNFADMFNTVAASYNPSVESVLDGYLKQANAGSGLDLCYREFAQYWFFNPDSGLPASEGRVPPQAADWALLNVDEYQTSREFSLAADYTASLWGIGVTTTPDSPSRNLRVETPADSLPDDVTIYVYVLPNRQRQPGGGQPAGVFNAVSTKSADVALTADDDLFVLAVNSGHSARQVTVTVSDTNVPPTRQPPAQTSGCTCDGEPMNPLLPPMSQGPGTDRWWECYNDCLERCGCARDDAECISKCF